MFGDKRLIEVVKEHILASATELADAIMHEVGRFQAGFDRFDDETVLVLRVREPLNS